MAKHIAKRPAPADPVLLLVSIFSFLIIHFAPGDPLNMYIRPDMTPEEMGHPAGQPGPGRHHRGPVPWAG